MNRRVALVTSGWIALSSIFIQAMAVQTLAASKPGETEQSLPGQVIVLEPLVQFEDVRDRSTSPRRASESSTLASRLLAAAKSEVEAEGFGLVPPEACRDLLEAADCARLHQLSSRLARGNVPQEAAEILKRLADATDDGATVLVQFMRVKVGPGGSWNPYSGAITSSISSTLLQAALVAGSTGQVIWSAEVFVRKTFGPDSSELRKNLALLYQTFTTK